MTSNRLWFKTILIFVLSGFSSMIFFALSALVEVVLGSGTWLLNFSFLLTPLGIISAGIYLLFNRNKVTDAEKSMFFCTTSQFLCFAGYAFIIVGIGGAIIIATG